MKLLRAPDYLYHYCSIEAFFGIINSNSLWLSDASSSNDSKENKLATELLDKELLNNSKIKSKSIDDEFTKLFEEFAHKPIFIFCLTEERDRLSQWRGYANDGKGVAIKFRTESFPILTETPTIMPVFGEYSIGLQKVIYNRTEQEKEIKKITKKLLSTFPGGAFMYFMQLNYIMKDRSFEEEKEWRIIHTPDLIDNKFEGNLPDLRFRTSNTEIVPYFVLPLDFTKNTISEIILGPKNKTETWKIKAFLAHNNLHNVEVSISSSTYR